MSSTNFHWVATDRRSDREVLNEIATADSSRIAICRNIPSAADQLARQFLGPDDLSAMLLWEPAPPHSGFPIELTSDWPIALSMLVTTPESFALIVVNGLTLDRQTAARASASLGEWLLRLHNAGAIPVRRPAGEGWDFPSLGVPARGKLTPPFPSLPDAWHAAVTRLVDCNLSSDGPDVFALKAGLFQWHDALDESHECAQSIEGRGKHRAGDYWHAIMHRREPDYGNSKYWFRHVGRHPIFSELGRRAALLIDDAAPEWRDRLLRGGWDPFAFVDLCETATQKRTSRQIDLAESIQEIEMLLLLASTYADASTG